MSCEGYPELPTFLPAARRVVVIGDIHGDMIAAMRCFVVAGLIDDQGRWTGGDTKVVQVGDQVDSCRPYEGNNCSNKKYPGDTPEDVAVIKFFDDMNEQAKKVGGAVYSLIGNHELMNASGNFTYVSYANIHEFNYNGETNRYKAFAPGGDLARHLACTRQSLMVIGSTIFVHAGILPSMLQRLDALNLDNESKLKYINTMVKNWLLGLLPTNLRGTDLTWIEHSEDSPFWTRVYGNANNNACYETLETLKVLKLGNMVVGHTPQKNITAACDSIFRVDTGLSKAFPTKGKAQVLEILDDTIFNVISEN